MSRYDEIRSTFGQKRAEEKLAIIRIEQKRLNSMVCGHATLLLLALDAHTPMELPNHFRDWCHTILTAADELNDLVEALTDPRHRTLLRQEQGEKDRAINERRWHQEQASLPELQRYASFGDAIDHVAQRLGARLAQHKMLRSNKMPSHTLLA